MSAQDRARWDGRYAQRPPATSAEAVLPAVFAPHAAIFPTTGHALDLACGRGQAAIWLARRGLSVTGYDISPVAIEQARELAVSCDVGERCHFAVVDLDAGLPSGPAAEVIVCHKFRAAHLDGPVLDRLAPGGLLAISALSEVGAVAGPFRIKAGELERAFSALEVIAAGAADGEAWLLGSRR